MKSKTSWTIHVLLICLVVNGLLIAAVYYEADMILSGMSRDYIDPLLTDEQLVLPQPARTALAGLREYIGEIEEYMIPALAGAGLAAILILWLLVQWRGRGLARRYAQETGTLRERPPDKKEVSPEAPRRYAQTSPEAAVQILSIMQRQGRLIDFLQEDLSAYNDAQIGAAVRNIHDGCKAALDEHLELKPIYSEEEGSPVQVPPGFDSQAVRLTGHVVGDPPFRGVLRHRGWRVDKIELPKPMQEKKEKWVLAPAEVEVAE